MAFTTDLEGIHLYGHWEINKKQTSLPLHKNDGLEIVYIKRGTFSWNVDGRQVPVKPGSIFFTLPWQEHGYGDGIHPGTELFFLIIEVDKEDIYKKGPFKFPQIFGFNPKDNKAISKRFFTCTQNEFEAGKQLSSLLPKIFDEFKGQAFLREANIYRLVAQLLIECSRRITDEDFGSDKQMSFDKVSAFLDEVEADIKRPWTLKNMAESCGMGRTQFSELVKDIKGFTPINYINRLRVNKAQEYLVSTDKPITSIAMECGFSSSSYFSKVFRDFAGIDARNYRLSKRK